MVENSSNVDEDPGNGVVLTGLYIEGGLWEINEGLIPSRYNFLSLLVNNLL